MLLMLAFAPLAHASKITVGSGQAKALYTYDLGSGKATYTRCKAPGKAATIPAKVTIAGQKYQVVGISPKAFAKTKATAVTVKTKKLAKARVKGALAKSKVGKIKVQVSTTTPVNNSYAVKYAAFFTKANAGKKAALYGVKVKANASKRLSIAKAFTKAYHTHWEFKNDAACVVNAEKAIAPYLAQGCTRDEAPLVAAPCYQDAGITAESHGLYVATVYCYYTQDLGAVTPDVWNSWGSSDLVETDFRFTMNRYGLITSIVA